VGAKVAAVKLTANFEANLVAIESFWSAENASRAYDRLLDDLLESVIPNLEQYPQMGRPFLARPSHSVEAQALIARLGARVGRGEIREYLAGDYPILYALIGDVVYLLAIRHHRQLSFDFEVFWPK
jgi:ParE toxin of type II toxin-antitoxin system, parDE